MITRQRTCTATGLADSPASLSFFGTRISGRQVPNWVWKVTPPIDNSTTTLYTVEVGGATLAEKLHIIPLNLYGKYKYYAMHHETDKRACVSFENGQQDHKQPPAFLYRGHTADTDPACLCGNRYVNECTTISFAFRCRRLNRGCINAFC